MSTFCLYISFELIFWLIWEVTMEIFHSDLSFYSGSANMFVNETLLVWILNSKWLSHEIRHQRHNTLCSIALNGNRYLSLSLVGQIISRTCSYDCWRQIDGCQCHEILCSVTELLWDRSFQKYCSFFSAFLPHLFTCHLFLCPSCFNVLS